MSITGFPDVTADGGQTTGLDGDETIVVKDISPGVVPGSDPSKNYVVVGVVAETASGTVNARRYPYGQR